MYIIFCIYTIFTLPHDKLLIIEYIICNYLYILLRSQLGPFSNENRKNRKVIYELVILVISNA